MSRRGPRHTLPTRLTSFVGREGALAEVGRLLSAVRLVTLVGAPGLGKTRLALELGTRLSAEYSGGVAFVELAPLADPALVPQAVSAALGVTEQPGRPLTETLLDYLRTARLLLILDNCEHLISACAELADHLLSDAQALRVLATSREPLGIVGEYLWRIPSLELPAPDLPSAVADLGRCEAVRLFVERAVAVSSSFELTAQNAPAVARICRQLDGIPLAIELAATRTPFLSPEQLAARLDDRFRLLTGGSRLALPRQQTLRGAIDWSHELLSDAERVLFRRLAVFVGGWTLEAAEAVCSGGGIETGEVLDLLAQLVDKSLVLAEERAGRVRYRFLETIREYAAEQLRVADEEVMLRGRHLDWFLDLATTADSKLRGREQATWFGRLEQEHDNLRAALAWSQEAADRELGVRLVGALCWFWAIGGYLVEGHGWVDRALRRGRDRSRARVRALTGLAWLSWPRGDYQGLEAVCREAAAISRELGDTMMLAQSLTSLGVALREQGDIEAAAAPLAEALPLAREVGDTWWLAMVLDNLGGAAWRRGDYARAAAFCEEALALYRELGDRRCVAMVLEDLGVAALRAGDERQAAERFGESLELFRDFRDRRRLAVLFGCVAQMASGRGELERAAGLFGAADALWEAIGGVLTQPLRPDRDRALAAARAGLGETGFRTAFDRGRAASLDRSIDEALDLATRIAAGHPAPDPTSAAPRSQGRFGHSLLTPREREVAVLIADGLTNRQIAAALVIAERTAGTHVANILNKLGFTARAQIAAWAVEHGLRQVT